MPLSHLEPKLEPGAGATENGSTPQDRNTGFHTTLGFQVILSSPLMQRICICPFFSLQIRSFYSRSCSELLLNHPDIDATLVNNQGDTAEEVATR